MSIYSTIPQVYVSPLVKRLPFFVLLVLWFGILRTAQAAPAIQITPDPLEFGAVKVGFSRDLNITILNRTNKDIQVQNIQFLGNNSGDFSVQGSTSFVLPAASSKLVAIRFTPGDVGDRITVVDVVTDVDEESTAAHGFGDENSSTIIVSPSSIDFGTQSPNYTKDTLAYLINTSDVAGYIKTFVLANASGQPIFDFTPLNQSGAFPDSLQPHDTIPILIHAKAQLPPGIKTGSIEFSGDFAPSALITLSLDIERANALIDPTLIDFGQSVIGVSRDTFFTITSNGDIPLEILDLSSLGPDITLLNPPTLPLSIPVGNSVRFNVRFTPQTEGQIVRQLQITFADVATGGNPSAVFFMADVLSLHATLGLPKPMIFRCAQDTILQSTFTVSNTGTSAIQITQINFSDPAFSVPNFQPQSLAGGSTATFTLSVNPGHTSHDAQIDVVSNGILVVEDSIHVTAVSTTIQSGIKVQVLPFVQSQPQRDSISYYLTQDVSSYGLNALESNLFIQNKDVFDLDGSSIVVNQSVAPGGSAIVTPNIDGSYKITLSAPTGILQDATMPLSDQPLFSFILNGFVTVDTATPASLSTVAPAVADCFTIGTIDTSIIYSSTCPENVLRSTLISTPLIISSAVTPVPAQVSDQLHVDIELSEDATITLELFDALGSKVWGNSQSGFKQKNRLDLSNTVAKSGNYVLRISAATATGRRQIVSHKLIIL